MNEWRKKEQKPMPCDVWVDKLQFTTFENARDCWNCFTIKCINKTRCKVMHSENRANVRASACVRAITATNLETLNEVDKGK